MLPMLADAESSLVAVEIVFGAIDVVMTLGLTYLAFKQREIHTLKADLQKSSEAIIQQQLLSHTNPLKMSIDNLANEMKSIHKRLDDGDGDFRELGEKRESMSLQMERKFGDLRVFLSETFANKADLKEHEQSVTRRFETMNKTTTDMAIQVAVLAGKRQAP